MIVKVGRVASGPAGCVAMSQPITVKVGRARPKGLLLLLSNFLRIVEIKSMPLDLQIMVLFIAHSCESGKGEGTWTCRLWAIYSP